MKVCTVKTVKPGFHIVVSVGPKKFTIGQIQLYGNLPYNCSMQQKRQIQLVVRDRMDCICPMNLFRTTDTTDTTDTTIWKPGLMLKHEPSSNIMNFEILGYFLPLSLLTSLHLPQYGVVLLLDQNGKMLLKLNYR